jgi:preprotein translocase subunit SecG
MILTVLLTIVHVVVCLFLIVVVLLQSGKAADLAGAFGGMGSQTAFGPRGTATALSKATTIAAGLFMVTSLSLAILASRGGGTQTILDAPAAGQPQPPGAAKPGEQPKGPQIQVFPPGGQPSAPVTIPLPPKPEASKAPEQKK